MHHVFTHWYSRLMSKLKKKKEADMLIRRVALKNTYVQGNMLILHRKRGFFHELKRNQSSWKRL